nr:uncharacterized protein LOC111509276 isoform X2 [Leptinotarsa decemlineata]
MAESSGSVVSNSVNSHKQSTSEQSTESSKNLVQKDDEPSTDTLLQSPPQATSAGTTGPILDLNLNKTNGETKDGTSMTTLNCHGGWQLTSIGEGYSGTVYL